MAGRLEIVFDTPTARIVVTDSLTYCDDRVSTADCVVGGSFIGQYPAALALRAGARAVIGHAAGGGKDHAGIAGLHLADRWSVPSAAVDSDSARLADGPDTWHSGRLSHVNPAAASIGVSVGMEAAEAARLMLAS